MEKIINKHLKENPLDYCIDVFSQKLKTETLSFSDSQSILFFLQANNQKKIIYNWILQKLKSDSNFSFSHLFWLLDNNVDSHLEDVIIQGLHLHKSDCSTFTKNIHSKKIQTLITQSLKERQLNFQQFKEELIEKIQYCKLNHLQDPYKESINELKVEFGHEKDPQIKALIKEFKQQNLEDILTKATEKYKKKKTEIKTKDLKLELNYKKHLTQVSTSLSKKNPQLSYDLSLLAQTLQLHNLSENILSNISEQTDSVIWLRAHNLIQSQKFLEALNLIDSNLDKIDTRYLLDYNYLKVFAWKGLNEIEKAIETLEEILTIKKNYRNAVILKKLYLEQL